MEIALGLWFTGKMRKGRVVKGQVSHLPIPNGTHNHVAGMTRLSDCWVFTDSLQPLRVSCPEKVQLPSICDFAAVDMRVNRDPRRSSMHPEFRQQLSMSA